MDDVDDVDEVDDVDDRRSSRAHANDRGNRTRSNFSISAFQPFSISPRATAAVGVAVATLVGLWLRVRGLSGVSLWLDETLNVVILRDGDRRWYEWLIGFERENGPLYYAIHAVSMRLGSDIELTWRLPELIAGTLTIPLIALAVWRVSGSHLAGLVAAVFIALSPFHVYYSREGRPYALLMLGAVLAVITLTAEAIRRRTVLLTLLCVALAATAATSVPLIAGIACCSLLLAAGRRERFVALAPASSLLLAALFYGRFQAGPAQAPFEETAMTIAREIASGFGVWSREGLQRADVAFLILALAGAFVLVRLRGRTGTAVIALTLVPAATAILALLFVDHWFSLRYVAVALPLLVILAASSITPMRNRPRLTLVIAIVVLSFWAWLTIPVSLTRPFDRTDWKSIATAIWERSLPGDSVIATTEWSAHSLRFYLDQLPERVQLLPVSGDVALAEWVRGRRERAWIVHAGFDGAPPIHAWACAYPALLTDPVEALSLHYIPSIPDFLQDRATSDDLQRFRTAWIEGAGGALSSGHSADAVLGEGWHGAERDAGIGYRWSRRRASLIVPSGAAGETLHLDLRPYTAGQLGIDRVTVRGGGKVLGESLLDSGEPVRVVLPVRERAMRIDLEFDEELVPSEVMESADIRPLSATLASVRLGGGKAKPGAISMRITDGDVAAAGVLCSGDMNRERALLQRAQITDVDVAKWKRRGRSVWELLAERVTMNACASDRQWLEGAYELILSTYPDERGAEHHLAAMKRGVSRARIARRIATEHLGCSP